MAGIVPEKAVRPARIARLFARCQLKLLCCYINPKFSVKLSDVSEHYYSDFITRKKYIIIKIKKLGKAQWSYDKILID